MTTPEVSSIRDADRIIGLLEASGIRDNQLVINRLRVDMVKKGDMMSVEDVLEILAVDLIGEESPAGKGYENICRRLTGEEIPVTDFSRHSGIRKKLSGLFHRR